MHTHTKKRPSRAQTFRVAACTVHDRLRIKLQITTMLDGVPSLLVHDELGTQASRHDRSSRHRPDSHRHMPSPSAHLILASATPVSLGCQAIPSSTAAGCPPPLPTGPPTPLLREGGHRLQAERQRASMCPMASRVEGPRRAIVRSSRSWRLWVPAEPCPPLASSASLTGRRTRNVCQAWHTCWHQSPPLVQWLPLPARR